MWKVLDIQQYLQCTAPDMSSHAVQYHSHIRVLRSSYRVFVAFSRWSLHAGNFSWKISINRNMATHSACQGLYITGATAFHSDSPFIFQKWLVQEILKKGNKITHNAWCDITNLDFGAIYFILLSELWF